MKQVSAKPTGKVPAAVAFDKLASTMSEFKSSAAPCGIQNVPEMCMQALYEVSAIQCEQKDDIEGWSACIDSIDADRITGSVDDFKEDRLFV